MANQPQLPNGSSSGRPIGRRRVLRGLFAGLGALGAGAAGLVGPDGVTPVAAAPKAEDGPRVSPRLLQQAGEQPNQKFRVIVQRKNKDRRIDSEVSARGHRKVRELAIDGFVAEVTGKDLDRLAKHGAVRHIELDAPVQMAGTVEARRLATLYPRAAGVDREWARGLTGLGVGVAVLDTGIANKNDFLGQDGGSRVVAQVQFNDDPGVVAKTDGYGHGTHVAGILAGNSWRAGAVVRGKYIGVAPEANLINIKVADKEGRAYTSDIVEGVVWAILNRTRYNIRVMNLSLVQAAPESYRTSILAAVVELAWFSGILVVAAAGNGGPNTAGFAPANDPFVLTVGASDTMGTAAVGNDTLAPWSSYGTTQDGHGKPDLVAPGRQIIAPMSNAGSTLFTSLKSRIVDRDYIWLSGTSMAAPVVAGVAALIFQQHPEYTNDQVKWLLMHTAARLSAPGTGAGAVQAAAALAFTGTPGGANQNLPISLHLAGPGGATTYTSSSWASSSWSSSSWSASSWASSSWSSSSWSASSWSASSWSTAKMASVKTLV